MKMQSNPGKGLVSGDCFATLGLHAFAGRLLTSEDDRPGVQTTVISYAWWQKRFHCDPGVIGKRVNMLDPFSNPTPVIIVGVLPPSFQSIQVGDAPAFFIPLPMAQPHKTASGTISESPLVLTDIFLDDGTLGVENRRERFA